LKNGRPSLYLVKAVFSWGWVGLELFVAGDANSLASRLEMDAAFAFGADPGEVTEEGEEVVFKETYALCPREFAVVAFCAMHRCLRWLDVHSHTLIRGTVGNVGLDC
jgi:hypothetical protein